MTLRYSTMDQQDALYTIARDYPGGLIALAARMQMSVAVLSNKLKPYIKTHYCSHEEVSLIIEYCQGAGVKDALAPLIAQNWRHGLVAFPAPAKEELSEKDLTQCILHALKEFSDLTQMAAGAIEGGVITMAKLDHLEKEGQEAAAAMFEMLDRLRQRAAADAMLPSHLK